MAVTLGGISLQLDLSDGNGKLDLVGRDVLTSVDTVLTGSAGSLTALGAGNINLTGYTGADVLVGNVGNNVFDGAAGMDTVRYDLTRAQATLTQAADGAIMVSSAQGNDTLRNIETLVFTNETVDLTTAFTPVLLAWNTDLAHNGTLMMGGGGADMLYAGGFSAGYAPEESMQMFRLYQATFNRAPDVAGHKNWTWYLFENKGDLSQVTERFMASKEFQNTYNDLDTEAFVDFLYQNILGRAADAEGRAQWISYLDSAARADVLRSFSESREFINSTHADAVRFTQERDVGNWSDDIFRLYTATLDRAPDKIGFESWTSALVEGFGFSEAVAGFVGSREFSARYGELDNNGFVELMYSNVLGRAPDVGGRQHWLNYMANGNSRSVVVEAFVQSRESVTRTAPDVEAWVKAQGVQDVLMGGGGDNVLVGGALSDTFVFNAARESTNRVLDLETWDQVHFEGFGYGSIAAVRSHLQQDGTNVVFADQGINIIFEDMTLGTISDEMIFV